MILMGEGDSHVYVRVQKSLLNILFPPSAFSSRAKGAKQVLKVSMQSNAPVPSDSIAYSAMIDAFTDKFDAPLRSGNYVAVIPWN